MLRTGVVELFIPPVEYVRSIYYQNVQLLYNGLGRLIEDQGLH